MQKSNIREIREIIKMTEKIYKLLQSLKLFSNFDIFDPHELQCEQRQSFLIFKTVQIAIQSFKDQRKFSLKNPKIFDIEVKEYNY
jgi:hypothetical protein